VGYIVLHPGSITASTTLLSEIIAGNYWQNSNLYGFASRAYIMFEAGKQDHKKGAPMATDEPQPKNIDEYIAGFPEEVQGKLEEIRSTIKMAAPEAEEAIKYQIPTFLLEGILVHFAGYKKHIGFYPTPSGIEKFQSELSVYEGAKGSVKFPLDDPIPFELISKIVKFRVQENLEKAAAKGKK
jgi:uncharacterized protein YdhG (YjbR/CyaY superfamily)